MPRSRVRPPHEALLTVTAACVDCGTSGTVQVEGTGRLPAIAYLCPACLARRVAQVQATPTPPVRPRGRPKRGD
jgi:hypothetical protein